MDNTIPRLTITTPDGGPIAGFWYLWAMYVKGFRPDTHCQRCLVGTKSRRVHLQARSGAPILLCEDVAPWLYICAGAGGGYKATDRVWANNLHLAIRPKRDASASVIAYNGLRLDVHHGEAVEIPELPAGWQGLGEKFTTCRNFRFGVAHVPIANWTTKLPAGGAIGGPRSTLTRRAAPAQRELDLDADPEGDAGATFRVL